MPSIIEIHVNDDKMSIGVDFSLCSEEERAYALQMVELFADEHGIATTDMDFDAEIDEVH